MNSSEKYASPHLIVSIEYTNRFLFRLGSWAFGRERGLHSSSSLGRSKCTRSSHRWRWRDTSILRSWAFEPVPIHPSGLRQGGLYLRISSLGIRFDVVCWVDMLHTLGRLVSTQRLEVRWRLPLAASLEAIEDWCGWFSYATTRCSSRFWDLLHTWPISPSGNREWTFDLLFVLWVWVGHPYL